MIKEHFQELEGEYSHKYQFIASMIKKHFQNIEVKDACILAMAKLHATKLSPKDRYLIDMVNTIISDRNKSNIISVFISCCLYNVDTYH